MRYITIIVLALNLYTTLSAAEISHDFIPETMRLEAEALIERVQNNVQNDDKAAMQNLSDTMRSELTTLHDSQLYLTNYYEQFITKQLTKDSLILAFNIHPQVIADAYFYYLANLTTTYRLANIPPIILIGNKKVNWRASILRKMLSLERMGSFYGTNALDKKRTTYWAFITLKNLLYK